MSKTRDAIDRVVRPLTSDLRQAIALVASAVTGNATVPAALLATKNKT
jgi:hypothetical protein